jgi:hypothetical protein
MPSKIGFSEVIRVRCSSVKLWTLLGWRSVEEHPYDVSLADGLVVHGNGDGTEPIQITSLVPTPWAYEHSLHDPSGAEAVWGRGMAGRVPIKFQLVCGPSPARP